MSVERRKHKRLPLQVSIKLETIEVQNTITIKYLNVDVFDLSRTGVGFKTDQQLQVGAFFDTRIQIWTKEVIDAVIKIIRIAPDTDGQFIYGCEFVGMTETDILKIDIYQMFNE